MGRPPGPSAVPVRLLAAAGTVAAAVVAHVGAGGAVPSVELLVGTWAVVAGLATLGARLPARLRSARVTLAGVVLLQPVLHELFVASAPSASGPSAAGPFAPEQGLPGWGMPVAHLLAAGLGAWWLARGAARVVAVAGRLVARLLPARPTPVVVSAAGVGPTSSAPLIGSRVLLAAVSRRGPPLRTDPLPIA